MLVNVLLALALSAGGAEAATIWDVTFGGGEITAYDFNHDGKIWFDEVLTSTGDSVSWMIGSGGPSTELFLDAKLTSVTATIGDWMFEGQYTGTLETCRNPVQYLYECEDVGEPLVYTPNTVLDAIMFNAVWSPISVATVPDRVNPVPLPATVPLLIGAVALLLRRRRY